MAKRRPSGDGMVRKREDGRWEGRIVIGHKENGAPIFHYLSARTQKELLEKLHRCIDEYDGAELTEDAGGVAGDLADRVRGALRAAFHVQGLPRLCPGQDRTLPG